MWLLVFDNMSGTRWMVVTGLRPTSFVTYKFHKTMNILLWNVNSVWKGCVFPWQSFKTQSTLHKMHCTLFGEDNGKQGRQFRLRLEYSNVELQSTHRIEWATSKGDGIYRPTKRYRARKTKQRAAWNKNHLSAETISAAAFAPNVHKESSRKHNSNRKSNPGSQTGVPGGACGPRQRFVLPAMLFVNFQIINIYVV